jgi:hypothetical protein
LDVAEEFCQKISEFFPEKDVRVVEPSAGGGAFVTPIQRRWNSAEFLDVAPEHPSVTQADFLYKSFPKGTLFVGNPPFGKNSSLAVRFFDHCVRQNPVGICMIHPKTFMKPRFWETLAPGYFLKHQYELNQNSFNFNGIPYDVPCVAQVWVPGTRPTLPKNLTLFDRGDVPMFIRRVGASAGKLVDAFTPSSTIMTRATQDTKDALIANYPGIRRLASMTAGVRSITLLEIEDVLLGRYGIGTNVTYSDEILRREPDGLFS